jgi:UDP-sugar transporter A1/2/3
MRQPHLLALLLLSPFDNSLCFGDSYALPHAAGGLVASSGGPTSAQPHLSSTAAPVLPCSRCHRGGTIGTAAAADSRPPSTRTRAATSARRTVPALIAASASASQGGDQGAGGGALGRWIVANRSLLLLVCLVVHKCSTDGLTRYTRLAGAYSGNTVAVMSEIVKFPLIATAIASFGGGVKEVVPTFKAALTSTPFSNCWIALCYTFNNLLYFDALGALSAVAYQVLSQSKTLFTAGLMYFIVGKRLIFRQILAIGMLIGGALLVQFEELARSVAGSAATAATSAVMATGPLGMPLVYWGAALTLFSSLISALPNVAYEKVLKTEGENQWVNNIQVCACVSALPARRRLLLSLSPCLALLPRPVSAWVCVVCRVGR